MTDEQEVIREQLRWIAQGKAGCLFAAVFANKPNEAKLFSYSVPGTEFDSSLPELLNAILDDACKRFEGVQMIFPDVTTDEEVVHLIRQLCSDRRWTCSEMSVEGQPEDVLLVGLRWYLPGERYVSWVLGFADLPTMPATRQAPYTAIALRTSTPGAAPGIALDNPKEGSARPRDQSGRAPVHLADMDTLLGRDDLIKKMWQKTIKAKSRLLKDDALAAVARAKVTFSLPATARDDLKDLLH